MSDRKQRLLDLFEKYKEDLDGGRLEALSEFADECNKELEQRRLVGNLATATIHSYILGAYDAAYKRAKD